MNLLRNAELPARKLSTSHSPNLDLCRITGNRSSMRSIDRAYDRSDINEPPPSIHSLDINRGIHSSHSSIDRKRGADEISVHSARTYDPTFYSGDVNRGADEASLRSYNVRRGSNLSLRSEENIRYGSGIRNHGDYADRDSRRGSDASLLAATLPMQRRPFNTSNEYGIANISESE